MAAAYLPRTLTQLNSDVTKEGASKDPCGGVRSGMTSRSLKGQGKKATPIPPPQLHLQAARPQPAGAHQIHATAGETPDIEWALATCNFL